MKGRLDISLSFKKRSNNREFACSHGHRFLRKKLGVTIYEGKQGYRCKCDCIAVIAIIGLAIWIVASVIDFFLQICFNLRLFYEHFEIIKKN